MIKIFLTVDPQTRRGLFENETKFLGAFPSMRDAQEVLGDMLSFCSIRFVA